MTYRLLAINIDGALLQSDTKISRQTKAAIDYVKSKGVIVTLITSKPYLSALKFAKALKLEEYMICSDGAYIAKDKEEALYSNRIKEAQAEEIVDIFERYDCHFRVFHEFYSLGNKIKQKNHMVAKMTLNLDEPRFYPLSFVDSVYDRLVDNPLAPLKIQAQFALEDELKRAIDQIKEMNQSFIIKTGSSNQIEIIQSGVSKVKALRLLANYLNVKMEEVVAIGVTESDREMVAEAGLGVAMGDAIDEVKQVASWVTRSKEEDGVAYMVREVFRKQLRVQI
ncbi:haloacid dehalogenase [Alkalihalobacillus alcalophilus ATCC 27647 = CGMCC 1.3604]|uniref:Haloacid dehalogenase n=1 Tax=Alkalihalobacillus alcalophilus ATCC 27647 = CGMCC 1.3604 TaxID=1218173 RepID=A0A094XGY7_ALKAL|nr:Cof-type HAD-IIB family hydrolase [Alkalihalobacillus alcalophilus]KGA98055.1 haloacid dehalogenase [Alkalihalobacillus alcalophilus ATCC 27647 = CGMCC 1.3604]MED1561063.1 Cof-type HAD-IIB family hydrolase [Alkalihalobacillus alcalophilus]THG88315.1 haloacid dehalogenase [Alkalihalobacillus alcalophilus ATCC 27647 = CGMCC 1.3604]